MLEKKESFPISRESMHDEFEHDDRAMLDFELAIADIPAQVLQTKLNLDTSQPAQEAHKQFMSVDFIPRRTVFIPSRYERLVDQIEAFEPLVSSDGIASFHGVFFGNFHLQDGTSLSVAVKPHKFIEGDSLSKSDAERSCLGDYFTNQAAQEACLGGLESVGFVFGGGETPFSLTLLDEELSPFDSIDWTVFYKEGHEIRGMQSLWDKAARSIATIHARGMSHHGDIATRNIATNPYGQVFLFDWEAGNVTNLKPLDAEERFGKSWVDLRKLMEDMATPETLPYKPGIGMFKLSKEAWWKCFKKIFFDEYYSFRLGYAALGNHRRETIDNTLEELAQLEGSLKQQMDRLEASYRV